TELGVVGLRSPLMPILRPVIDEQQDARRGNTLAQDIQKPLRLGVNPVQVFKNQDERLIQTLAQHKLLYGLKRPPAPDLGVHLLQRRGRVLDAQERKQVG